MTSTTSVFSCFPDWERCVDKPCSITFRLVSLWLKIRFLPIPNPHSNIALQARDFYVEMKWEFTSWGESISRVLYRGGQFQHCTGWTAPPRSSCRSVQTWLFISGSWQTHHKIMQCNRAVNWYNCEAFINCTGFCIICILFTCVFNM